MGYAAAVPLRFGHARLPWRRVFLTLAILALAVRVMAPPGYMIASSPTRGLPQIVLCTGHGPVTADLAAAGPGKKAPEKKSSTDAPCVFAGHGVALAAPDFAGNAVGSLAEYATAAPLGPQRDLAPGRGLAAPPLPARGPPSLLT